MEKSLEYRISQENNIKKEPQSFITRAKKTFSNIFSRGQKPERTIAPQDNKNTTPLPKGIIELAEKRAGKEEVKGFGDFIAEKLNKPFSKRTFLKIAIGTAVGAVSADYAIKNIDSLWAEYQEKKVAEAINESKGLQSSINLLNKVAEYPEAIEKSDKQTINEFAKDLAKKDFDNLIFGEWHGLGLSPEKAAYLLEELIKNNKKISVVCFEILSYADPEDIEAIKKFNKGELPVSEMGKIIPHDEPLLEFAKKYKIDIAGIEKEKTGLEMPIRYERFKEISERIGEISKEKSKDGVVVTYIGQDHVTADSWPYENLIKQLSGRKYFLPSKEDALKNNYTIKEYLEKINMKPIAIQLEDWEKFTYTADGAFARRVDLLSLKDKKIFYEEAVKKWQSYNLIEEEDFVVPYPFAKENTYSMIIPSEISEKPPKLSEKMGDN